MELDFQFIGQLLQALILAIVPVLAGAGVRWLVAKGNVEKAKLTVEQQYMLETFVKTAIYAAEQMKFAGYIDNKLDWAESQVQTWCDRNKILISVPEIRVAIESAVFTEFNEFATPADNE